MGPIDVLGICYIFHISQPIRSHYTGIWLLLPKLISLLSPLFDLLLPVHTTGWVLTYFLIQREGQLRVK